MREEKFFMVFVEGGSTPSYKHPTFESAQQEAQRLCELFKKKAYVLEAVVKVEMNKFKITSLVNEMEMDEIPF